MSIASEHVYYAEVLFHVKHEDTHLKLTFSPIESDSDPKRKKKKIIKKIMHNELEFNCAFYNILIHSSSIPGRLHVI